MSSQFATALREARERKGWTQAEVGEIAFLSNKMVSEIERGNRRMPKDARKRVLQQLDDASLCLAAGADATGGVFVVGPLDGIERHPSAVALKSEEEIEEMEAVRSIVRAALTKPQRLLTDEDRQAGERFALETIDVITCLQELVRSVCDHFGHSVTELYELHRRKLVERGYKKADARQDAHYAHHKRI